MQNNKKVVYSFESRLNHPYQLIKQIWQDLISSRELAIRLCIRDIKAQYRQSFLGILWIFIPPVIMAIGFSFASKARVIDFGVTEIPYPAYIIVSVSLWQTFIEALNGPVKAVTNSKSIVVKVNFPHEALILANLGQILFGFSIKLILIIAIFFLYEIEFGWAALLSPFALLSLIVLGTFLGVLITPFAMLYHDFSKALTLAGGFWFVITPVVYPLPEKQGIFSIIVHLNPVTPLLVTTRDLATQGGVTEIAPFLVASLVAFLGMNIAWVFYRLAMPFVIERISA